MRSDAPVVRNEALVEAVEAFGAKGFAEAVPNASVEKASSVGVHTWDEK